MIMGKNTRVAKPHVLSGTFILCSQNEYFYNWVQFIKIMLNGNSCHGAN